MLKRNLYYILSFFGFLFLGLFILNNSNKNVLIDIEESSDGEAVFGLERMGLNTNTSKFSIDLEKILSGGPGKDGIPALFNPNFVNIEESKLDDDVRGIFVEHDGEKKYYPYSILVWHEIANDTISGKSIAVTFCPLCGTGIVFDREVEGEILEFGVSGLLFESNLLMYDKKTESLWSQARGDSVVGELLGQKLTLLPMQLISFAELKKKHPEAMVLSEKTGHLRDYNRNPYSGYEDREETIFPISINDKKFFSKELMYVFPYKDKSFVIPYKEILDNESLIKEYEDYIFVIETNGEEINVSLNDEVLPAYFEMWFSWATHHQEDGVVLE